MARSSAVEHIRLEHRVKTHTGKGDAVVTEHGTVILEVLADLFLIGIFQQGAQRFEHFLAVQLQRRIKIIMCQRNVGGLARLDRKRDPDDSRTHRIDGRGLGIESKERRLGQLLEPAGQDFFIKHDLVLGARCTITLVRFVKTAQFGEPGLELKLGVQLA